MKQVDITHYSFSSYVTKARFVSFWHQIDDILSFRPKTVLEIGPGPGIVTDLLRKQGVDVTTCDYADDVVADVHGSVLNLPLADQSFDVVGCFQVLEHIPYESFTVALAEINRVARMGAIISLPHAGPMIAAAASFPILGQYGCVFNPLPPFRDHEFDGQHYWEIGKSGYRPNKIRSDIKANFDILREYRPAENPFHHFFVCATRCKRLMLQR